MFFLFFLKEGKKKKKESLAHKWFSIQFQASHNSAWPHENASNHFLCDSGLVHVQDLDLGSAGLQYVWGRVLLLQEWGQPDVQENQKKSIKCIKYCI